MAAPGAKTGNRIRGLCVLLDTLFERFNQSLKNGTPAERRLAKYYLEHPGDISFETAASVADKLDLSPMTVGRFLRALNIDTFAHQPHPIMPTTANGSAAERSYGAHSAETANGHDPVRHQVEALYQVQALTLQPDWRTIVMLLSRASEVFLTSLGQTLPMSAYFAGRLAETRDGVRHLSGGDGTYLELLGSRRTDCLLIIVDDPHSSPRLQRLSKAAREAGHTVLMVTHSPASTKDDPADHLIRAPALINRSGPDPVALAALIEYACAGVAAESGPFATERAGRVAELLRYFGEVA